MLHAAREVAAQPPCRPPCRVAAVVAGRRRERLVGMQHRLRVARVSECCLPARRSERRSSYNVDGLSKYYAIISGFYFVYLLRLERWRRLRDFPSLAAG